MPYSEPFRPQFHFSPAANWLNDPNGLVYYEGEYHLFYQYHPHSTVWGPMHWGHAVSPDLVHWMELPIALYPDAIGDIWSGSVVVDERNTCGLLPGGGLAAVYSYNDQSVGLATSGDRGRTWTKYAGNPVMPSGGDLFRDPKVSWHAPTGCWSMVISAGDRVKFFTSPDLIHWTFASDFSRGTGDGAWECPDLFPLTLDGETKWVLVASIGVSTSADKMAQYFIGDFDGTTFSDNNPAGTTLRLDYGPDNYAGVTFNNAPGGDRVLVGWMSNWDYAKDTPTDPWRGAMTLPRHLELRRTPDGIRLAQRPAAALDSLRGTPHLWENQTVAPGHNLLRGLTGRALDIVAAFEPGSAAGFGFRVLKGGDSFTAVGYDAVHQKLFVDRSRSGQTDFHPGFAAVHQANLAPEHGRVKLRVLVDWSSVEAFGGDGQAVITSQVFPDRDGLELYALGGEAKLVSLEIYPLASIWTGEGT
jgi:fructan beta-fructosidase